MRWPVQVRYCLGVGHPLWELHLLSYHYHMVSIWYRRETCQLVSYSSRETHPPQEHNLLSYHCQVVWTWRQRESCPQPVQTHYDPRKTHHWVQDLEWPVQTWMSQVSLPHWPERLSVQSGHWSHDLTTCAGYESWTHTGNTWASLTGAAGACGHRALLCCHCSGHTRDIWGQFSRGISSHASPVSSLCCW